MRGFQPLGVLVEHGVHDVDEGLIAREQAVAAGEQVALQPALAGMLAENLHDATRAGEVHVIVLQPRRPLASGHLKDRGEAVGGGLVRAEEAEVAAVIVQRHDVAQEVAQNLGRLARRLARRGHRQGVGAEVGQAQVLEQQPGVGVGIRPILRSAQGTSCCRSARSVPASSNSSSGR